MELVDVHEVAAHHDRGARPRRRPGNAGDGVTLGVGKFRDPIRVGLCRIVDQTQPAELQAIADLTEQTVADVFDGERDRSTGVAGGKIGWRTDCRRRDDGGPAEETLDHGGASAWLRRALRVEHLDRVARYGAQTATQKIEYRRGFRAQIGCGDIGGDAGVGIFDLIVGAEDHLDVAVEVVLQPFSEAPIDPIRVVAVANFGRRARRRRDALELVQGALAMVGERLPDQFLLVVARDFIGALRGRQHRHDNAHDRDGNDHADRHDRAHAGRIPSRGLPFPGDLRLRRRQHASTHSTMLARQDHRNERLQMACD